MNGYKIEALFGGLLALAVLGVAIYALATTEFGDVGGGAPTSTPITTTPVNATVPTITATAGQDLICECYDDAFAQAAKSDVLSPEYRTGFEQCRARGGVDGGEAWTAGWNARLNGRPYEASCKAYKRRR